MVSSEVQSGLPTTVSGLTHNTTTNSGSTVRTFPTSKALPHSSPLGGSSKDALSNLSSIEPSGWTLPQIGDCYHQWMQYWNATAGESVTDEDPEQITTILSSTESAKTYYSTVSVPVSEIAFTRTKTLINKGPGYVFPIATSTSTAIDTQTVGGDSSFEVSTGPTVTYVTTIVTTVEVSTSTTTAMITTPGCTLPSIVPQCQSAWNTFLRSGGDRPICEAASIASSACQSSIEARFSGGRIFGASGIHAWVTDGNTTFWPTRTSYAPGCTLGCQSCAITGDTVRVLYWPPSTASIDKPGMNERAVPVSTRSDTKLVTALVGNTTLTSPTVYVSYRTLYASNSCGRVGRAFTDIIVPLAQHQELSSLAYTQLDDWAFGPGRWGLGDSWKYITKSFDFNDLIEPVPNSIYNQLPWCASYLADLSYQASLVGIRLDPATYVCNPHPSYAPLIAVPIGVSSLEPAWASCSAWYGGLYDPPKALTGVRAEATLTTPSPLRGSQASPSSAVAAGLPNDTGTAASSPLETMGSNGAVPLSSASAADGGDLQDPTGAGVSTLQVQTSAQQMSSSTQDTGHADFNVTRTQNAGGAVASLLVFDDPTLTPSPSGSNSESVTPLPVADGPLVISGDPAQTHSTVQNALSVLNLALDSGKDAASPQGQQSLHSAIMRASDARGADVLLTVDSSLVTVLRVPDGQPGALALGGTTISIGGPAVTVGSEVLSEGSGGVLLAGGSTAAILPPLSSAGVASPPAAPSTPLFAPSPPALHNESGGHAVRVDFLPTAFATVVAVIAYMYI